MNKKCYVSDELKKYRIKNHISREKLGAICGVCSKTIQRAEAGNQVRMDIVKKLSKGTDLDLKTLVVKEVHYE